MNIKTKDKVNTKDKLVTFKPWIGKLIKFFTVKLLPPRLG